MLLPTIVITITIIRRKRRSQQVNYRYASLGYASPKEAGLFVISTEGTYPLERSDHLAGGLDADH